jgi:hypothetical protein
MDKQLFHLLIIYAVALFLTLMMDTRIPFLPNVIPKEVDKKLDEEIIPDMLTGWQVTHLFTRILCGFVAPEYWMLMFGVDLSWEFTEYFLWKNHNWLDIVWNTIGIVIGIYLRSIYDSKFSLHKKYDINNSEKITQIQTRKNNEYDLEKLSSKLSSNSSSRPVSRKGYSFKSNPSTPDI